MLLGSGAPLPRHIVLVAADADPAGAIDELEKYEGMRVQVDSLTAVPPAGGRVNEANATASSNALFHGVVGGIARSSREPGVRLPDTLPPGSPCCVVRIRCESGDLKFTMRAKCRCDGLITWATLFRFK